MTSNAYITTDGETVLKVGKTNDFWKRIKQIGLPMTAIISCPDEATALLIETELRHIVVEMGGIRRPEKIDWFEFDPDIHMMLQAFLESLRGYAPTYIDGLPDNKITKLREEYVEQLKDLQQKQVKEYLLGRNSQEREIRELKSMIANLEEERNQLRKELAEEREKQTQFSRELGQLEGKYAFLEAQIKNLGL